MSDWISYLKEDPTEWLLEPDNPSVRYLTLTEILGKPVSDPQVKKTRNEIIGVKIDFINRSGFIVAYFDFVIINTI